MSIDADDLRRTMRDRQYQTVFQPVLSLRTGNVTGVEALTRFTRSSRPPAEWFAAAHAAGVGTDLELAAAGGALAAARRLPEHVVLWLNLSPVALADPAVPSLLESRAVPLLGVQVTGRIEDAGLAQVGQAVQRLRHDGVHVSIAGSLAVGLARSPRPALLPDQVRAGIDTTQALHRRRGRARAGRIVTAARGLDAAVLADGIETPRQLGYWTRAGADEAQGFLIGAPGPLQVALTTHGIIPDLQAASPHAGGGRSTRGESRRIGTRPDDRDGVVPDAASQLRWVEPVNQTADPTERASSEHGSSCSR